MGKVNYYINGYPFDSTTKEYFKISSHANSDCIDHCSSLLRPCNVIMHKLEPDLRGENLCFSEKILVNRGWVEKSKMNPTTRPGGQVCNPLLYHSYHILVNDFISTAIQSQALINNELAR